MKYLALNLVLVVTCCLASTCSASPHTEDHIRVDECYWECAVEHCDYHEDYCNYECHEVCYPHSIHPVDRTRPRQASADQPEVPQTGTQDKDTRFFKDNDRVNSDRVGKIVRMRIENPAYETMRRGRPVLTRGSPPRGFAMFQQCLSNADYPLYRKAEVTASSKPVA